MGTTVLHGVDVKKMRFHKDLKNNRFDRIVFNLPHAGFKGKEDDMHMIKYVHYFIIMFFGSNHLTMPWFKVVVHVLHIYRFVICLTELVKSRVD